MDAPSVKLAEPLRKLLATSRKKLKEVGDDGTASAAKKTVQVDIDWQTIRAVAKLYNDVGVARDARDAAKRATKVIEKELARRDASKILADDEEIRNLLRACADALSGSLEPASVRDLQKSVRRVLEGKSPSVHRRRRTPAKVRGSGNGSDRGGDRGDGVFW